MPEIRQAIDLNALDHDIAALWLELREARLIWAHNPCAGTLAAECEAECRLNKLLEFRHKVTA